jgi:hypothetical protein
MFVFSKMLGRTRAKCVKAMEDEIKQIQSMVIRDEDIQHYRDLDASRIQWNNK